MPDLAGLYHIGDRLEEDTYVTGGVAMTVTSVLGRDGDGVLCVSISLSTKAPVRIAVDKVTDIEGTREIGT